MQQYGISYDRYTHISDDRLKDVIEDIRKDHRNMGEVMVMGHLRSRQINVQRRRVRQVLEQIDPEGLRQRRSRPIQRRSYDVPCPNYMWHIDGNHKLIRYRMVIHCGIDGFSRLITFLRCSDNNKADTVLALFHSATDYLGFPLHVRTDHGGENVKVWESMYDHHGSDTQPVLTGRSVHNQRVERNNRDLNICITTPFKDIFTELEHDGHLNVDNETDIFCLHYVYIPRINNALVSHQNAHNSHKISTEASATPSQLFYANNHLRQLFVNAHISTTRQMSLVQSPDLSVVTIPATICPIPDQKFRELQATIDPLKHSVMQGKDIFLEVVEFVGNTLQHSI
jgi:hypothetical protein